MNIKQSQVIIGKINRTYIKSIKPVKWTDIYGSEAELLEDLKQVHIPEKGEWSSLYTPYKGYEFIHSFASQIQAGKSLSGKQITQCKRLAIEIKKAASIRDCY